MGMNESLLGHASPCRTTRRMSNIANTPGLIKRALIYQPSYCDHKQAIAQ